MSRDFLYTVKQTFGIIYSWQGLGVAFFASLFFAWVPDTLRELLEEALPCSPKFMCSLIFLLSPIVIVISIARYLRNKLDKLADLMYEVEEDKELDSLRKARVIFMGYSTPGGVDDFKEYLTQLENRSREERLETLESREDKFNWIMQAVLLREFLEKSKGIEKVIVIPSKDSIKYKEDFLRYMELMGFYKDNVFHFTDGVDYEDVEELQRTFNTEIKKLKDKGTKEKEIFIDITAGQKTFSIVSASVTFESDIRICYVSTKNRAIRVFDIRRIERQD